jgi:hypothetical protein
MATPWLILPLNRRGVAISKNDVYKFKVKSVMCKVKNEKCSARSGSAFGGKVKSVKPKLKAKNGY